MSTPSPPQALDWLALRAGITPRQPALIWGGDVWSYDRLQAETRRLVGWLHEIGVSSDDRVAVLLPNRPGYVCLVHALARLGALLVPLNTRLTPMEFAQQMHLAGCRLLIHDSSTADQVGWATSAGMPISTHNLDRAPLPAGPSSLSDMTGWPPFALDRPQAIVFTSGSSGAPKGALLTFANHFWSATGSLYRLSLHEEERWLSCLPLYHVGGLAVVMRSCLYGSTIILHERFDLDLVNRSLDRDLPTIISLVPTMLYRLLRSRSSWPASLRLVLLGGAAADPALLAEAHAVGLPVALTYGLTEAASQVATMLPAGVRAKPGSVGKPLMFTQVRIVDGAGAALPAGQLGEVIVAGPTVMSGYDNQAAATRTALSGGWLHTGDIGYLDEDGDLWLVQRRSDLIVSGGENVFPADIEGVLHRHPDVLAACVVGLPDAEWGQQVVAMVAYRPSSALSIPELERFCRAQLAGYKRPRRFMLVAALPQTASGKVSRPAVRAAFLESAAE